LLLDPAKELTDDFLADIASAATQRRIVLMLDTFEQMTALDDWARDVAQRLHANALFVIAGRALPNWSRAWDGWMANAQVEELKPMTEDDMRELVRRYYATMRGGQPNPVQVEAIIRFARGLPMVVTSAVQLWGKYGVQSERFRNVTLTTRDIEALTILDVDASFAGEGKLLRLGLQAYALGIAYEFDPYFALSISRIDPLPH
jgi:hypothetical protein